MKRSALLAIAAVFTAPASFHGGMISAGRGHSVVLSPDGNVWTWGDNTRGQLGDGTLESRRASAIVPGLQDIAVVAAGLDFTLALDAHGRVFAWGANQHGQLGNGSKADSATPVEVSGLTGVLAIAAGENHGLALKSDGQVWSWGANMYGQLGDGTTTSRATPLLVEGLTLMTLVGAGADHSLAVAVDGTIWAWGRNHGGQIDRTLRDATRPVRVDGLLGPIAITGGASHSLALLPDGSVWSWGKNDKRQLGDGTIRAQRAPVQVQVPEAQAISARGDYSLALSAGSVWRWGAVDAVLAEPLSLSTSAYAPQPIAGLENIATIAVGTHHAVAADTSGVIWTWGSDTVGQLGEIHAEPAGVAPHGEETADDVRPEAEHSPPEDAGTPASRTPSTESVVWTARVNANETVDGGLAKPPSATPGWDGGAISTRGIGASADGYLEFTAAGTGSVVIGLSHGSLGQSWEEIQYGIHMNCGSGVACIQESGSTVLANVAHANGDVFRIALESGDIVYRQNGAEIHRTSSPLLDYPLQVDVSVYASLPGFSEPFISGELVTVTQNVVWTAVASAIVSGNNLSKLSSFSRLGAPTYWDAGGVSVQQVIGTDGYFEFTAGHIGMLAAGLSHGDSGYPFEDIDYAIFLEKSGVATQGDVSIRESGVDPGAGWLGTFVVGDRFRIAIEGDLVVYRQNSVELYSHAIDPALLTYPLLADVSLKDVPASVLNAVISDLGLDTPWFDLPEGPYTDPVSVTIHAHAEALIQYTTDGSDPDGDDTEINPGESVPISEPLTLKARAYHPQYEPSGVATITPVFQVRLEEQPVAPPPGYIGFWDHVSVDAAFPASGATLHYTTNGDTPDENDALLIGSLGYSIVGAVTVKVRGFALDYDASALWEHTFDEPPQSAAPALNPPSGTTFVVSGEVAITAGPVDGVIAYTTDGTAPTWESDYYADPIPITEATTIRAVALEDGSLQSEEAVGTYSVVFPQAEPPTFEPPGGTYSGPQTVLLDSATPDATVHYTIDGTPVSENSPAAPAGTSIDIKWSLTLEALAVAPGLEPSDVVTAGYEIRRAPKVAAAKSHSTAIDAEGTVLAWGSNDAGQLGDSTSVSRHDAQPVPILAALDVGNGGRHSVALLADGTVWAWGDNEFGQLGNATNVPSSSPVQVGSLSDVTRIAVGDEHGLALTASGSLWAWGSNAAGQLGSGSGDDQNAPVELSLIGTVVSIAAGADHSLALLDDGTVMSWGNNSVGQLGTGSYAPSSQIPVPIAALSDVVSIASGPLASHSFAVTSTGEVWAWGLDESGQLGIAGTTPFSRTPQLLTGLAAPILLSAGGEHSLAVASDGSVRAWGSNWRGQLGVAGEDRDTPAPVSGLSNIIHASAGGLYSLAVTSDGIVFAWGDNGSQQLGTGGAALEDAPVAVSAPEFVWRAALPVFSPPAGSYEGEQSTTLTSASPTATIHVLTDGQGPEDIPSGGTVQIPGPTTLTAWASAPGLPDSAAHTAVFDIRVAKPTFSVPAGPLSGPTDVFISSATPTATIHYTTNGDVPTPSDPEVPPAGISVDQTMVLRSRAFLTGWSDSDVASALYRFEDVGQVAAGAAHSLLFDTAGLLWAWGSNTQGQLGTGSTIEALLPGRVNSPTNPFDVASLAGGALHSVAILDDMTAWAWGEGYYGAVGSSGDKVVPFQVVLPTSFVVSGIVAGGNHTLFLASDDATCCEVWGVGSNAAGQLGPLVVNERQYTPVYLGLDQVVSVAAGRAHSLALRSDGSVWSWGNNDLGQLGTGDTISSADPTEMVGLADVVAIYSGADSDFSFAVEADGSVWGWGANAAGQLGIGTTSTRERFPVEVAAFADATLLSAGAAHTVAVLSDGTLWATGSNAQGQLGDATTDSRATAEPVLGLAAVVSAAAGGAHTLALTADGRLWVWGSNEFGQLGDGTLSGRLTPVELTEYGGTSYAPTPGLSVPTAAYRENAFDVTVWAGTGLQIHYTFDGTDPDNEDPWVASPGQITIDQPAAFRLRAYGPGYIPSDVSGASYTLVAGLPTITPGTGSYPSGQAIQLSTVTQGAVIRYTTNGSDPTSTSALYTGDIVLASSMALRAKSFREGWGSAGIASADFVVGESAGSVAGGIDFSLALTSSGEVWAWGAGDRGQLGNGDIIDSSFPVAVSALTGIVSIAAGDAHALALDSTGTLWAWGAGDVGQLGNGNSGGNADSAVPVQVSMPTNVVAIAAGANHSLAIDDAGDVFAWGSNATGQLGDGSQANNATPALVAGFTTDVKGIAAGDGHSIALLANRRIWAWGDNFDGQVGSTAASTPQLVPIEVTGIDVPHAVVAGAFHSLALTSEGTLWAWGAGAAGQLGSGNTDDVFEPILVALSYLENRIPLVADGGAEHTLALWSDGVVRSWGSNLQGQLGRITTGDAFLPKSLPLPVKAFHVASGATHSLAVGDDGSIWAWGSNGRGQLGDWTTVQRDAPVQIASAGSLWQTAEPVLTPAPGDYADELSLTVAAYPASANVHYTTDGEEPTQLDDSVAAGGTLAIAQNADLRLKTFAVGWGPSETVSAEYRLHVATPSVLPVGDTYAGPQTVTVAVMTAGATIHYTLNGAEPTDADPGLTSGQTLDVGASATLRVKAFKDGWTPSGTVQEHYRIPLAAPIIDPAGGALTQPTLVTLSSLPGATIRYTTDGLDPNWTSTRYTSPINIGSSLTLKARAYAPGWTPSGVSEAMYTMDPSVVQAPLFSVAAGSYASEQKVVITQQTPGSVIRFTLTGIDPVASDTVIGSGSFITVDQSLSLRAKAFVVGVGESSVTRAEYAITGAIAAGGDHTLALQSDGTVLAWGSNTAGQLGDGSTIDAVLPQVVPGLTGVTAIAAGTSHSLALLSNGSLKAWGANDTGQSGIGQGQQSPFPSDVPGIVDAVRIAAAGDTSYAVLAGGAVLAWGANDTYQLGDGTGTTPSFDPVPITAFSGISIVNVSAGGAHALAVDAAGTVWAWGSDAQGQLGGTGTSGPSLVPGLAGVTAIAAGATASFALVTDGAASGVVHGWGEHRHGDTGSASSPEPLFGSVRSMDAGAAHVLAVKLAASVWAWGSNTSGQVGDGSTLDRTTPIRLFAPPGAVQVAAGTAHSLALDAQGGVWSWGANGSGQLGDGLQADRPFAAALSGVSLASGGWLAEDPDGDGLLTGEELAWGTDPYNYDTNGDGLGDGESIAAGIDPTATDVDADGLDNPTELAMGTDPFNPDTDGDGVIDGLDAFPLDPTRSELVPVNGDETPPLITIVQPDASLIP